jgi:VWFA-related protein
MASLAALMLSGALPVAALSALSSIPPQSKVEIGPGSAAAPLPAPQAPGAPQAEFGEEIAVRLFTVVVRVVDGEGRPILGLTPADFRLRVGKQEVPLATVDWSSSLAPAAPTALPTPTTPTAPRGSTGGEEAVSAGAATKGAFGGMPTSAAPGKLVVVFVEADNNEPGRVRGHLRTLPFTRELLASLEPDDRVAVVSFDSHLKLWQDFTREREAAHEAIYQGIHFGGRPPEAIAAAAPAADLALLALHFDREKAQAAASPERALEVLAEALAPLPGEKVLVFLGWGLGCFSSFGTQMTPAYAPAVRALKAARVTVFVLDVTEAGSHDLEVGLQSVAEATGGTYDKTFLFPGLAVAQLAQTISGYYVLSVDREALPKRGGAVTVELRRRGGTVLLRPTAIQ